jgi:hypothetical protein
VPRATTGIADEAGIVLPSIQGRTNKASMSAVRPLMGTAIVASTWGEGTGSEQWTSAAIVSAAVVAVRRTITSTGITTAVQAIGTERAPLNRDVKMPDPIKVVGHHVSARENGFDACLCHLVQLMGKSHHAQVGREVSVVIGRVIVVDAGHEHGDGVDLCRFLDSLDE